MQEEGKKKIARIEEEGKKRKKCKEEYFPINKTTLMSISLLHKPIDPSLLNRGFLFQTWFSIPKRLGWIEGKVLLILISQKINCN